MGQYDSSLTRVQPVFNQLLDDDPSGMWIQRLCEMATATRVGGWTPTAGALIVAEAPRDHTARMGKVFERIVPPPTAFLRWLLEHPERMNVKDSANFGAKGENADRRRKLFSTVPQLRAEAQHEALDELERRGGKGSGQKWWAFEGFSHVDCCLITESLVLFIEGKRTENVSPSTQWFAQRSQLWRNVEGAREFAVGKDFGVILAVEESAGGRQALMVAESAVSASYPHLSVAEQNVLSGHLLGYVTWSGIVSEFGLPKECLIERVPPAAILESLV